MDRPSAAPSASSRRDSAPRPTWSASAASGSGPVTTVSRSSSSSRLARRCRPARSTATSTPAAAAPCTTPAASRAGSTPDTTISSAVTGRWVSRTIEWMLPPRSEIRRAISPTAPARSGRPSTMTWWRTGIWLLIVVRVLGDRDLDRGAERLGGMRDGAPQRGRVAVQGEHDTEDEPVGDDHLLDVEHLDVVGGDGREEG